MLRFSWNNQVVFPKSAMELSNIEWNEDLFENESLSQIERDSLRDDFGSIPIGFYIFGGIIAAIVIGAFIFVIFVVCYTLIKGNRNLWFQQPIRGRFGRPPPMHSCNFHFAHLIIMFYCVVTCSILFWLPQLIYFWYRPTAVIRSYYRIARY